MKFSVLFLLLNPTSAHEDWDGYYIPRKVEIIPEPVKMTQSAQITSTASSSWGQTTNLIPTRSSSQGVNPY